MYNKSDLSNNQSNYLSSGEFILADGGFIGGPGLLVPITETTLKKVTDERTKETMKDLNSEFTANRLIVEDVFGWLKARACV